MRPDGSESVPGRTGAAPLLAGLVLFGLSFGFVEAAVVIDLRAIYEPIQRAVHPESRAGELFPLIGIDVLTGTSSGARRLLGLEVAREAATICMLAAVGLCAGGAGLRGFAAFLVAFGVWDVSFYAFLRLLIGWPASLFMWDLLFLIPVPWVAPVLAPLIIALTMAVCGAHTIVRSSAGSPIRPTRWGWLSVLGGGLVVWFAFCRDHRYYLDGGVPHDFAWPLFWAGECIAVIGYLTTARRPTLRTRGEA